VPLKQRISEENVLRYNGMLIGVFELLADARSQIASVNAAIEALSEDLRQAITLREIEGLSYEEIAEVMDCPIGTVRSRIFRARESIAARLRPLLDTRDGARW